MFSLFHAQKQCSHPNITPENPIAYCGECGELVEINWYLLRCERCTKKRLSYLKNKELVPQEKYCTNCGGKHYTKEKLEKLSFFDVYFAVPVKTIVEQEHYQDRIQTWVDIHKEANIAYLFLYDKNPSAN